MTPKQLKNITSSVERMGGTEALSARVRAGDDSAVGLVLRAVRYASGDLDAAACAMGTSMRSLQRWIASEPKLSELHRPGGRPRKDAA